jgi:hypothetical protein
MADAQGIVLTEVIGAVNAHLGGTSPRLCGEDKMRASVAS